MLASVAAAMLPTGLITAPVASAVIVSIRVDRRRRHSHRAQGG